MAKKNLKSVAAALAPAVTQLPTQNVTPQTVKKKVAQEPVVQFSFGLRKAQRKELQRLASDEDLTMRAFILRALKEQGLTVSEEDLQDSRQRG